MVVDSPHTQVDGLLSPDYSLAYQATPLRKSLEPATFGPSDTQRSDALDRSDLESVSAGTSPDMRLRMEHQSNFFVNHSLPDQAEMDSYSYDSLGGSMAPSSDTQRTGANGLISTTTHSILSNVGQEAIPQNATHRSAQISSLTAATPEDSADRTYASRDYQPDQESSDDSTFRRSSSILTSTPSPSIGSVARQISNTKDLLSIVNNYSRLLLQDDYHSPFMHLKLYSGSYADMSVMAKSGMAACCASAYENSNSIGFVSKFIIKERERLVHTFVSFPMLYSTLHFVLKRSD